MIRNFSGLVARKMVVRGVEIRPLNFSDLSRLWNADAQALIEAFDNIAKNGETKVSDMDAMKLTQALIQYAPDLAREAFLAAVDDTGEKVETGRMGADGQPEQLLIGEVWDRLMGVAEQTEMLTAIISMTVAESDNLKKTLQNIFPKATQTTTEKVQAALTTQ